MIPLCVEHGIAYQAYSPLAGGWLSGKYRRDRPVPPDSRLALVPQWYEHIDGSEAFTAIESLTAIGESDDVSIAALALAWVHHQPHVSEMVVGPRSHEHFRTVWEATRGSIGLSTLKRVAALFPVHGNGG